MAGKAKPWLPNGNNGDWGAGHLLGKSAVKSLMDSCVVSMATPRIYNDQLIGSQVCCSEYAVASNGSGMTFGVYM